MEDDQDNIRILKVENEIDTLKGKVKCLETVEDLRDKQMKVLETVIKKQIAFIERSEHEWKVLDIPEAKK